MIDLQKLNINMSITIPEDMVIITKVELEELEQEKLKGVYWSMKNLEMKTGRSANWLKDNILFKPQFKKILDSQNGGCVFYPRVQGQPWAFQASKMAGFLDNNFCSIFGKE